MGKFQLNITGERFEGIDFSEACIFLDCPPQINEKFSFQAWGVTLMADSINKWCNIKELGQQFNKDTYISGLSTITVDGVAGGSIEIAIYDPNKKTSFIKMSDGDNLKLRRIWKYNATEDLKLYEWDCVIDWPHGYCQLKLAVKNNVTIEFDKDLCIPVDKFLNDTEYYQYKEHCNM